MSPRHFPHCTDNMVLFTHVIDTDLHLEAICCFPIRTHHHSGVVDEDVEFRLICRKQILRGKMFFVIF